jgi:hypothetical protein
MQFSSSECQLPYFLNFFVQWNFASNRDKRGHHIQISSTGKYLLKIRHAWENLASKTQSLLEATGKPENESTECNVHKKEWQ